MVALFDTLIGLAGGAGGCARGARGARGVGVVSGVCEWDGGRDEWSGRRGARGRRRGERGGRLVHGALGGARWLVPSSPGGTGGRVSGLTMRAGFAPHASGEVVSEAAPMAASEAVASEAAASEAAASEAAA